jgi:hypothetical protein
MLSWSTDVRQFRTYLGLPPKYSGRDRAEYRKRLQGSCALEGVVLRGTPREHEPASLDLDVLERKADAARTAGTDVVLTVEEIDAVLYWIYSMHQKARS